MKKRRKKKHQHASHKPEATVANKRLFLAALAKGDAPGDAARFAKISRTTAYNWRKEDEEFASNWIDAVETGIDHLETVAYIRAVKKSDQLLLATLRARRPGVWGRSDGNERTNEDLNKFLQSTLQEKLQRLERLGLPPPIIESDFEVVDVADNENNP